MFRTMIASSLLVLILPAFVFAPSLAFAIEQPADIDEESTHKQTRVIEISQGDDDQMQVNAFCLNKKGEILAACGEGPGEIRVLNDQGKLLRSWKIDVKPEAINVTSDGEILAGGEGKLFKFSATGKKLIEEDAPHAESLRENTETLREEAIAYLDRYKNRGSAATLKLQVESYERMLKQIEEKDELTEQDESLLKLLPDLLKSRKASLAIAEKAEKAKAESGEKEEGPDEEAIAAQVKSMMKSKMRIASISTDGESVFVATRALKGYGFAIWKTNQSMAEGEEIVTGLSGCCGQMDVQACENGLFVAENSRKRVVRYDSKGEELLKWGKADRTGLDGFTSCCNPMNVCFNKNGDVFTAESNTGRIKRFSAEGEFLDFVGDVKLVPGCKNVSIAVTPNHDRVYMLDLTRNHIVVMEKKPESQKPKGDATESTASTGDE